MRSRPSAGRRPGELFPRVGFLVTNLPFEPAQVFHFYNQHARAITFQLAEVAVCGDLFHRILAAIHRLRPSPVPT